jgi:hypothetical protein
LKPGISIYIPCKNEAAHLVPCLESLLGIVDQFILIDNGSDDGTLELMREFQRAHAAEVAVDVVSLPDALLVEMVQHALRHVRHRWVLKWDGDMIARREPLLRLRAELASIRRPTAFTLPRLNLSGDYEHVSRVFVTIDAGEPFLRTFYDGFVFHEELGRLEHAVIPLYYRMRQLSDICSFHLSDIRPPLRILYRHCYLDWRETMNLGSPAAKERFASFPVFRTAWMEHNFGTSSEASARFRYARLIASMARRADANLRRWFTPELTQLLDSPTRRFRVQYKNDEPYLMMDNADPEFARYEPTAADLAWQPDYHRFHDDGVRLAFTKDAGA